MIGAALRHRQGQPWMYEAIGLAMGEAGRPRSEIERAVMSAVEFADSTADLMYLGAYLLLWISANGPWQVYRQAAALDPYGQNPIWPA